MLPSVLYFAFILLELVFAMSMTVYVGCLLYSGIMGSPYVPTKKKRVAEILKHAGLKRGQYLLELGCGDGRLLIEAAKKYGTRGLGIDVNPLVIAKARLLARGVNGIEFKVQNLWNTDMGKADVIYLFLMPELLKKLVPTLRKKAKKGTLVISHAFVIKEFEKKLVRTITAKPFSTFYYRL